VSPMMIRPRTRIFMTSGHFLLIIHIPKSGTRSYFVARFHFVSVLAQLGVATHPHLLIYFRLHDSRVGSPHDIGPSVVSIAISPCDSELLLDLET
jgi:hypothetical protein